MSAKSSHIERLDNIKHQLENPPFDQHKIVEEVRNIFRDAGYKRMPYRFRFKSLFRAAAKDDEAWFNSISGKPDVERLHCPPVGRGGVGRCNWPGEPVFYCSTENGVPVFEVRAGFKQIVVISNWQDKSRSDFIKRDIEVYGLAIGVQKIVDTLPVDDNIRKLLLEHDDFFRESTPKAVKEIDTYIGDLFTKSSGEVPNLYWLTSAITRVMFGHLSNPETGAKCDGFIYPSVESKFSGQNIVLKEEFARRQLRLNGAAMYKVIEYKADQSSYKLKPMKELIDTNGSTIWKKMDAKFDGEIFPLSPETQCVPFHKGLLLVNEGE